MILAMSHLYLMGGHSKSAVRRLEKLLFVQKKPGWHCVGIRKMQGNTFLELHNYHDAQLLYNYLWKNALTHSSVR